MGTKLASARSVYEAWVVSTSYHRDMIGQVLHTISHDAGDILQREGFKSPAPDVV
ncbi:hypothetical protein SAMN05216308_104195 [Nitrosospira sp. Nsp13]|nr:hypothetical protein SAMN05216308_104195 [Nitrosospira sp. Nsp13]